MPPTIASTFGSYVDQVGGFLSGLSGVFELKDQTVDEIMKELQIAQSLMPRDGDVEPIPGRAFGTLPANSEMDIHSTNAREYVMGALHEMLTTLGAYDDGVIAFRNSANGADDLSAAELLRVARATQAGRDTNDHGDD